MDQYDLRGLLLVLLRRSWQEWCRHSPGGRCRFRVAQVIVSQENAACQTHKTVSSSRGYYIPPYTVFLPSPYYIALPLHSHLLPLHYHLLLLLPHPTYRIISTTDASLISFSSFQFVPCGDILLFVGFVSFGALHHNFVFSVVKP